MEIIVVMQQGVGWYWFNRWGAKLNNLIIHPLEAVSRYRDPQLQVGDNHPCLFFCDQTLANLDV